MRASKAAVMRTKKVLLTDKTCSNLNFLGVLKSDIATILQNYAELKEPPKIKIELAENGLYTIEIKAEARRIIGVKTI